MAKGKPHYLPNGKLHTGATHKEAGVLMTGEKHKAASKPCPTHHQRRNNTWLKKHEKTFRHPEMGFETRLQVRVSKHLLPFQRGSNERM